MSTESPPLDDPFPSILKALLSECGDNKHDRAKIGITACIDAGIVTRKGIRETLGLVGLNPNHVVIVLNSETGSDPSRHSWQRDEAGEYRNID